MTTSDWADWLPAEVATADPDDVTMWYLGCNGFVLKGADGTTIFVDPYVGIGDPPRTVRMIPVPFDPSDVRDADAVFATHEHTDHVHGPSQAPILAETGADFFAPDDGIAVAVEEESWLDEWDVDEDQLNEVSEGDTVDVGGFEVSIEPANDPDATHPVSYVFAYDGTTIFHGGDSKPAAEFADLGRTYDIDVGILAFGSVGAIPEKDTGKPVRTRWYNDENQIVEAANDLQFDRLVPSHWDMWKGMTSDPTVLHHHARSFEYPRRLDVVEIGDRIDL